MRRQPTAHSFQHTTRRTAAHTWRRGYPGTMCERPQRPRCHAHSMRSWLGMYIYVRMRPCGALAAIFARARGPATRDARYRAAERVNVCAGPSSQNSICGQFAVPRGPRPAGAARRRKGARRGESGGAVGVGERHTSRRWRGARARGTAGRVPGTQDPRDRVSRDWRTHIIRRHAGADRPETRPGHEMYTARDITHPGAAQPRITSSSTRADGHPDDGTEDATRLPDLRGYS